MASGAVAADKGKTPLEAVSDELAGKVYSAANGALRKAALGTVGLAPADVVVGPLLEQLDDALPRKVKIPPQNVTPADEAKTIADFFIDGFCEDSYTETNICLSPISYANVDLAQAIAQGIRDIVHICARPAEASSEGLQTEASVELVVNTIHTLPLDTQKKLGLDAFAADLQSKVGGDPKALLSALIQGTASVAGNVARMIPEAKTNREGANRSFAPDVLLKADIPLEDLVSPNKGLKDFFSPLHKDSVPTNLPFNVPQGKPGLGGEHLSGSVDVLLHASIPLPDLVLPGEVPQANRGTTGGEELSSSVDVLLHGNVQVPDLVLPNGDLTGETSSGHKREHENPSTPQESADSQQKKQPCATNGKEKPPVFGPFTPPEVPGKQADEEPSGPPTFDLKLDDRPPDFERFTGEFSITFGPDRLAEARSFANLCAFYKKYGWPKERLDYELKVRRNKVQHREEKVRDIDVDVKLKFQQGRVQKASANLKKAEQLHAKTKKDAYKISEAMVDLTVELESLNRITASLQPGAKGVSEGGSAPQIPSAKKPSGGTNPSTAPEIKPEATDSSSTRTKENKTGMSGAEKAKDTQASSNPQTSETKTAPQETPIVVPTTADIQSLEAEIMAIDVKIEGVGKEEQRATRRAKRYKKRWKKLGQKCLHKFFNARKPGTVVEEETILGTLNHDQKVKLEELKTSLLIKLEEMKKLIRETPAANLSAKKVEDLTTSSEPGRSEEQQQHVEGEAQNAKANPDEPEDPQSTEQEAPKVEEAQSLESAAEDTTENSYGPRGVCLKALQTAKKKMQKAKEKVLQVTKNVGDKAEMAVLEGHEKAFYGKEQLHEAKRLKKIAKLIEKKLSDGRDGVTLKMKDGQIKTLSKEQALKLKTEALQKSAAKTECAARNVIEGSVAATAAHSVKSGARRLAKHLDKIHLTGADALGSNAGAAVVDLGARCIAEGGVSKEEVGEAAKEVVCQTVKGVATQVFQDVARSTVKGVVKEIAPQAASYIPGVSAINSAYTIGSAVYSSNTVGEAICNGTSAAVDMGISCAFAAAGQACIPIPVVGAFVGSAAGSLAIKVKNGAVSEAKETYSMVKEAIKNPQSGMILLRFRLAQSIPLGHWIFSV
jgi:hypothetical protein